MKSKKIVGYCEFKFVYCRSAISFAFINDLVERLEYIS